MRLTTTLLVAAAAIVACKQASADTSLWATNEDVLPQSVGEFDTSKNDNDDERMFNFITRIWEHLKSIFHIKSTSINPKPETNIHSETIPASVLKQDDANAVSHTSINVDSKVTDPDLVVVSEYLKKPNNGLETLKRLWNKEKDKDVNLAQFMWKHNLRANRIFEKVNNGKKKTDEEFLTIDVFLKALTEKDALKKYVDDVEALRDEFAKKESEGMLDAMLTNWVAKDVDYAFVSETYGHNLAKKYSEKKKAVQAKATAKLENSKDKTNEWYY